MTVDRKNIFFLLLNSKGMYIASRCTASKCNKARAQQKDKEDACVVWSKEARQGTNNLPVKFGFWWGLSIANTRGLTALQIGRVRIVSTRDAEELLFRCVEHSSVSNDSYCSSLSLKRMQFSLSKDK